jgi:hypothetical protein
MSQNSDAKIAVEYLSAFYSSDNHMMQEAGGLPEAGKHLIGLSEAYLHHTLNDTVCKFIYLFRTSLLSS